MKKLTIHCDRFEAEGFYGGQVELTVHGTELRWLLEAIDDDEAIEKLLAERKSEAAEDERVVKGLNNAH